MLKVNDLHDLNEIIKGAIESILLMYLLELGKDSGRLKWIDSKV
jgi:hypothetical protein